jgi:hypothetical protein
LVALGGCRGETTDHKVQAYRQQQASQMVADYEQARSRRDMLAMCVKGNQVSAAYRDAKDPADAEAWKAKAAEDCRVAHDLLAPDTQKAGPPAR